MTDPVNKQELQPILTAQLFPELLTGLLDLLATLGQDQWEKRIPRKAWTVNDTALHLLGGDVGILSRRRDGYLVSQATTTDYNKLVTFLKIQNDLWIRAARRISPRLVCELLGFVGVQANDYFQSLDPYALGDRVSWAGSEPAPNWLNIAQEYTERWHHQQHIREAVGRPGFTEPRFLQPALDTFIRALPYTYRHVGVSVGTTIEVTIAGDSGGSWLLVREHDKWHHYVGNAQSAETAVTIPQELAWKLWTKWITKEEALRRTEIRGNEALAIPVLDMISVIA